MDSGEARQLAECESVAGIDAMSEAEAIDATIAREGWADGTGLVKVDGMPHCPKCGYINRKTKHCVNCGSKLKV